MLCDWVIACHTVLQRGSLRCATIVFCLLFPGATGRPAEPPVRQRCTQANMGQQRVLFNAHARAHLQAYTCVSVGSVPVCAVAVVLSAAVRLHVCRCPHTSSLRALCLWLYALVYACPKLDTALSPACLYCGRSAAHLHSIRAIMHGLFACKRISSACCHW